MSDRPLSELAREITHGAVRLSAATAAWLMLVAEFDERGGWGGAGLRSCAHWLSWQCGLAPGAAREHVRVARALRRLPLTRAAFLEGRISYAKARALTRVVDPACRRGCSISRSRPRRRRSSGPSERSVGWRRSTRRR